MLYQVPYPEPGQYGQCQEQCHILCFRLRGHRLRDAHPLWAAWTRIAPRRIRRIVGSAVSVMISRTHQNQGSAAYVRNNPMSFLLACRVIASGTRIRFCRAVLARCRNAPRKSRVALIKVVEAVPRGSRLWFCLYVALLVSHDIRVIIYLMASRCTNGMSSVEDMWREISDPAGTLMTFDQCWKAPCLRWIMRLLRSCGPDSCKS